MVDLPEGAPVMDDADARRIVRDLFGIDPLAVSDLGSYQDRNFRIETDRGSFVLKVASASTPASALAAQNAAMVALARLPVAVPAPVSSQSGAPLTIVNLAGADHAVRLLSFVAGIPMTEFGYLSPAGAFDLGQLSGSIARELADFDHPGAHRFIQWDIAVFEQIVERMIGALDPADQAAVRELADRASDALGPLSDALPRQVIHGDVTDFNVVAERGVDHRPSPTGVIDFGDLVYSWRAAEAAVTISSQLVKNLEAPLAVAAEVLAGFVSEQPLSEIEVEALWPMIAARACVGLVSSAYQLRSEPDNAYLHQNLAIDEAVLATVSAVPFELGHAVLAQATDTGGTAGVAGAAGANGQAGLDALATARAYPLVVDVDIPALPRLDLSVMSDLMSEGSWLDPQALRGRIDRELGGGPAIVEYREAHLHMATVNASQEPSTIHLAVDVILPAGTPVCAPRAGRLFYPGTGSSAALEVGPDGVRLATDHGFDIVLKGLAVDLQVGAHVRPGEVVGTVAPASPNAPLPPHLHVQLVRSRVDRVPSHVQASLADAWSTVCPDPSFLLGRPPAVHPETAQDLRERRLASLAHVQKHYYEIPPRIERGWRHYLADTNARVYLDGINNVTVLGHSHPAVADAVDYQLRTLNTNSRFHYSANVDFAHMLLETLPDSLSRVFLVSTGSEAVDLALRLARTHTGAKDTITLRTAYHGWTSASDEVSSALMDNPRALETRPPWIHLAEPPNLYRGPFRGQDAGTRYADDVRRLLGEIDSAGSAVAAFICETLNGNAGGIMLPPGYLDEVYRDVRAAGGVVIADEVQVGYGRLGEYFWGFEMHGVVPDIVCLAKATGNGYPVAAVVCTDEIAQAFAAEGSLFASTGGSPAGAAAAIATLTAIQQEDLQGNAARTGARLRAGLQRLVDTYEMAGAVHGMGLYLGLEIVTDKASQTPATEATEALCDRLLELGAIMAPTGDYLNVLKIKPPLCIDAPSADFLVTAIERALRDGW